jgi:hypothetical protein
MRSSSSCLRFYLPASPPRGLSTCSLSRTRRSRITILPAGQPSRPPDLPRGPRARTLHARRRASWPFIPYPALGVFGRVRVAQPQDQRDEQGNNQRYGQKGVTKSFGGLLPLNKPCLLRITAMRDEKTLTQGVEEHWRWVGDKGGSCMREEL